MCALFERQHLLLNLIFYRNRKWPADVMWPVSVWGALRMLNIGFPAYWRRIDIIPPGNRFRVCFHYVMCMQMSSLFRFKVIELKKKKQYNLHSVGDWLCLRVVSTTVASCVSPPEYCDSARIIAFICRRLSAPQYWFNDIAFTSIHTNFSLSG